MAVYLSQLSDIVSGKNMPWRNSNHLIESQPSLDPVSKPFETKLGERSVIRNQLLGILGHE